MGDFFRILMRRLFPPLFSIRIEDGSARKVQGRVTGAFIDDCSRISRRSGIDSAWIWGHGTGTGVRLEFSSDVNEGDRQRFRNTAGIHGL